MLHVLHVYRKAGGVRQTAGKDDEQFDHRGLCYTYIYIILKRLWAMFLQFRCKPQVPYDMLMTCMRAHMGFVFCRTIKTLLTCCLLATCFLKACFLALFLQHKVSLVSFACVGFLRMSPHPGELSWESGTETRLIAR